MHQCSIGIGHEQGQQQGSSVEEPGCARVVAKARGYAHRGACRGRGWCVVLGARGVGVGSWHAGIDIHDES